ncbi:MAG: hypothetical protein P1V97_30680, partial [Planctomycetota bacterium]|nr:hypothetical protein [Planctomycetota bacterium]
MTSAATPIRAPIRHQIVEFFAFSNLAFLAIDIYLAHSVNDFAHGAEWIPFVFSLIVPLFMIPALIARQHRQGFAKYSGLVIGVLSVIVGIAGMIYHLENSVFQEQTLKSLVYAAPFAGPLSYSGVGLLLILNRLEWEDSPSWARWVLFLTLCGFVGNFALSLCDHAQNGFFAKAEWVSVGAAAMAISFLLLALRDSTKTYLWICVIVMIGEVLVGIIGAGLHIHANFAAPSGEFWDRIVFGAPVFAPLLFANLGLLGLIGLWDQIRHGDS